VPVRIKSKTRYQGSVTPSALNTETDLVNIGDQTDDYIIEGAVSLQNLASGDTVVINVYIAVDGANQKLVDTWTFTGAQSVPVVRIVAHTIPYNGKFRVTVKQTAGTLRAYPYYFILEVMETI